MHPSCSVIFLRTALGSAAVPQPAIDLGSAFGALGDALGFGPLNPPFTPYQARSLNAMSLISSLAS